MKRTIAALAVALSAAATLGVGTASAAPTTIANGLRITPTLEFPGYGTLGSIGYDSAGRLVGITAGHVDIDQPGGPVYIENNKGLGAIGQFVRTNHQLDYAVIQFDPAKVRPSSNGPALRIDGLASASEPRLFQNVCKDGQTTGLTCGVVLYKDANLFDNNALAFEGDSGGPVVVNNTKLAGITLRVGVQHGYGFFVTEYLSINSILRDIPAGTIGSGFTPVVN